MLPEGTTQDREESGRLYDLVHKEWPKLKKLSDPGLHAICETASRDGQIAREHDEENRLGIIDFVLLDTSDQGSVRSLVADWKAGKQKNLTGYKVESKDAARIAVDSCVPASSGERKFVIAIYQSAFKAWWSQMAVAMGR